MSAPRFRARPGVVVSRQGEARYLTDLATGKVFELNQTALEVFEAAARGADDAGVVAALAASYPEVPAEELDRDARETLEELVRAGLLERAA